jgi:hypothetical protein
VPQRLTTKYHSPLALLARLDAWQRVHRLPWPDVGNDRFSLHQDFAWLRWASALAGAVGLMRRGQRLNMWKVGGRNPWGEQGESCCTLMHNKQYFPHIKHLILDTSVNMVLAGARNSDINLDSSVCNSYPCYVNPCPFALRCGPCRCCTLKRTLSQGSCASSESGKSILIRWSQRVPPAQTAHYCVPLAHIAASPSP